MIAFRVPCYVPLSFLKVVQYVLSPGDFAHRSTLSERRFVDISHTPRTFCARSFYSHTGSDF